MRKSSLSFAALFTACLIPMHVGAEPLPQAPYSVFAIVDALTRIAGRYENAGDRLVLDQKAATLLSLAA